MLSSIVRGKLVFMLGMSVRYCDKFVTTQEVWLFHLLLYIYISLNISKFNKNKSRDNVTQHEHVLQHNTTKTHLNASTCTQRLTRPQPRALFISWPSWPRELLRPASTTPVTRDDLNTAAPTNVIVIQSVNAFVHYVLYNRSVKLCLN